MTASDSIVAGETPADVLDLARRPDEVTAFRLWSALDPSDREEAARTVLELDGEPGGSIRDDLLETIAETFNFRPETLRDWGPERVARYGRDLVVRKPELLNGMLRAFHVHARSDVLADFLDSLDVANDDGVLPPDTDLPEISDEDLDRAATKLLERHGPEKVLPYFLTLHLRGMAFADGIGGWLETAVPGDGAGDEPISSEEVGEDVPEERVGPTKLESTDEFTTLDRLFVRAVADASQGIEGALSEDQLEDAVQELVALNSSRHRSFFHAGFMDGELGRSPRAELPAQNADRLRWYWAGYLTGLARREQHDEIVRYHDEQDVVRTLGDRAGGEESPGASHAAARLVFEGLCRAARPGEAASFLEVETVLGNQRLFDSLQREGTRLLREDRAAEAHGIFDLLGRAVEELERLGVDTTTRRFLQVRRRRAHCYRQLDEAAAARELLERLLDEERDPEIRSMVHTDLGLIDAGFRRLADLRIPDTADRMEAFLEALEEGEERFREGAELEGARYAAHGRYCLGVIALLREEYEDAVGFLDRARAVFESSPQRYSPGGLLANARAYLGMAVFLALETGRMEQAARLVRDGVDEGASVPRHFAESMVEAAEIRSPDLARALAESLLEARGDELLEVLAETDVAAHSADIADALLERAGRPDRGETDRTADLRSALPLLLEQERPEDAADVLDALENAAVHGTGRPEFLEILEDPARYEPAWEGEDAVWARIRCLEAAGRYEEASGLLADEFNRTLAAEPFAAAATARQLIQRIDSYGLEGDRTERLERRLEAFEEETAPEETPVEDAEEEPIAVRILFVGGDERQEAHQEAVREKVEERDGRVHVDFVHPGWSSSWGNELDRVVGMLPDYDGVALMRFVRTEFGRQLRKELDVPWYACTAHGRRSMAESIVEAARLARRRLRS